MPIYSSSRKMASTDQPDPPTQSPLMPRDGSPALPREALIITAVKFLQNPKVRQSPLATRKAFLKKKGLTDDEVDLAIQRSGSTEEVLALSPVGPPQPLHGTQLALSPDSPPGYRWRDYSAFAVIMVGVAVGLNHLYKKYILPLIMGRREDKKHLQRMESAIAAMSGTLTHTVTQLQQTLASVQELLVQQQQRIQQLSQDLAASEASSATNRILDSQTVGDLKAEIVSLKGLLLGRRQFPATPSVPKIPSWQIPLKPPTSAAAASPPVHHHSSGSSSSDISPVSNESAHSSPVKDGRRSPKQDVLPPPSDPTSSTAPLLTLDLNDQVRMEVQGEEESREVEEEEEEEVGGGVEEGEEEHLSMQTEDRPGGDGQQISEQVAKLRRPEGASNDSEVD